MAVEGVNTFCDECAAGKYTAACQDDLSWRSSFGASCLDYTSNMWCAEGTYGPGWDVDFGTSTFADWGTDGIDASHACCECGSKWNSPGASVCTDCAAGKYSAAGASVCDECEAGKFSELTGQTSSATCIDCMAGTYSAAGASFCTDCEAGKYSAAGAAFCTDCEAGKNSVAGAPECTTE